MSNTNDPQEPYVKATNADLARRSSAIMDAMIEVMSNDKPTERAPLLRRYNGRGIEDPDGIWVWYNDIQAKITSGELRVVKKVNVNDLKDAEFTEFSGVFQQCTCGATLTEPMNFCPGCGSEIVGG